MISMYDQLSKALLCSTFSFSKFTTSYMNKLQMYFDYRTGLARKSRVTDFQWPTATTHPFTHPCITYGNRWLCAGSVCACGRVRCLSPSEEELAANGKVSWLGDGVVDPDWSELCKQKWIFFSRRFNSLWLWDYRHIAKTVFMKSLCKEWIFWKLTNLNLVPSISRS